MKLNVLDNLSVIRKRIKFPANFVHHIFYEKKYFACDYVLPV